MFRLNWSRHDPQGKTIVPGAAARSRRRFDPMFSSADSRSPETSAGSPQQAASRNTATALPEAFTVSYAARPISG